MKLETIELRKMTASEGMVLTNGNAFSSVGGFICLAYNDTPENWCEITEEEYLKIQQEMEKEI